MQTNRLILAVDIGGTLTKLVFISNEKPSFEHMDLLSVPISEGQQLNYMQFKSEDISKCIKYISQYLSEYTIMILTGGGSFKYASQFEALNKRIEKIGEFESLLSGIESLGGFKISNQFYQIENHQKVYSEINEHDFYPFLIVNVGSGVSILKISKQQHEKVICQRVGGTCLGGGFFLGLSNMITSTNNFAELLEMAKKGNNHKVDIVPSDYPELEKQWPDLKQAPVLVSLGKFKETCTKEDKAKSLFLMVAYNIAQMALMHSVLHQVHRVVFTGFFCRNNTFMLDCFSQAFSYFLKTKNSYKCYAYGLKHDGFLGAMGALYSFFRK